MAGTCAASGGSTLGKEPLEVSAIFFVITCDTVSLTGLPSASRTAFPSASNLSCSTLIVRCVIASVFTPFCVTKSVTENVSPASSVTSSPTETLYKITSPDSRVTPCSDPGSPLALTLVVPITVSNSPVNGFVT